MATTYLEGVANLHRELELNGTAPASVLNQTGLNNRLCKWYAQADYNIQRMYRDWNFLHTTVTQATTTGSKDVSVQTDLGTYDYESFVLEYDTDDYQQLDHITYKEWRANYRNGTQGQDKPYLFAIGPDRGIILHPVPDDSYSLTYDYWKTPTKLADNTDVSDIPEQFIEATLHLAMSYFYAAKHDGGKQTDSMVKFAETLEQLKAEELPDRIDLISQPPELVVRPA